MKILHCASVLDGGGSEKQLEYLATHQAAQGNSVHIAQPAAATVPVAVGRSAVRLHPLRTSGFRDLSLLWDLCRVVRTVRPQIIQTWHLQMDILGGLASMLFGIPFVMRESSSAKAWPDNAKTKARKTIARYAAAVISNSKGGDEYWSRTLPSSRRFMVENAIPANLIANVKSDIQIDKQGPTVLFAGRFVESKNISVLIAAITDVLNRTAATAILFGDGPLKAGAARTVAENGVGSRVRFPGHVASIWEALKGADVLVLVSKFEGRPNVVLEAMACECPLVVSDIPAHREILNGQSAVLVSDFCNAACIADAVVDVLNEKTASRTRARVARASIRAQWDIAEVAEGYQAIYEKVISAGKE